MPVWREALAGGMLGERPTLAVAHRDRWNFIKLWCKFHDSVRGSARTALKEFARTLGMPDWALSLASHRRLRDRILGLSALGRMGELTDSDQLERLLTHPDPILSLTAAQAYARIMPPRALLPVLQVASRRDDWPAARLVGLLLEVGTEAAAAPLLTAVETTRGKARKRLIPLLICLESRDTVDIVRKLLGDQDDPETLAAALPLARPDDMPLVRLAADNPAWFVRAKACQVLGNFGAREDFALLESHLGDQQWWVRYRAAEALSNLPGVSVKELRDLAATHPDPYGREMMRMWLDGLGESA